MCTGAWADVAIDAANFPDDVFREYVSSNFDTDNDGTLSDSEIDGATQIDVSNQGISSLKGVEYLTALTQMYCASNDLTSLIVTANTNLSVLICANNQLKSLNVSRNTALTELYCSGNQLQALDVSKNTALTILECQRNQIKTLDVSKNTVLRELFCQSNQLTALDLGGNTSLSEAECAPQRRSGLILETLSNSYALDFSYYDMTSEQCANISDVQGLDANGNNIDTTYSNGDDFAGFASRPSSVRYTYYVGSTVPYDLSGGQLTIRLSDSGGVEINATNFPDDNFRSYVSNFDTDSNGVLSDTEIANVTFINVNSMSISSLKGIEYLTALTQIYCESNQLTALDVSNNTALTTLYCSNNQLTVLNMSNNTALTELHCQDNQLTTLDVSNNTALTILVCFSNQLTELDMSNNTALTYLECPSNQLTVLNVSNNTALTELHCQDNQLTTLDVSKNTALTYLGCHGNQLTELDVSKNTALYTLDCQNNKLTSLNVSNNTTLSTLYCYGNQLTTLDVSNNTALTYLSCHSQGREGLIITSSGNTSYPYQFDLSGYMSPDKFVNVSDVQGLDSASNDISTTYADGIAMFASRPTKVTYIYNTGYTGSGGSMDVTISGSDSSGGVAINSTNFPDEIFRAYVSSNFDTDNDGVLSDSEIANVTSIYIEDNSSISSLRGVEYFTALDSLYCAWNQLTVLDVSKNTALTSLYCARNQLTSLDVSNNTALTWLDCDWNQLTTLDVSNNTALTQLDCGGNQLTTLDVSNNTALTDLNCWGNQLTTLNVSNNTALTDLYCGGNNLTALDVSQNTKLTNLLCNYTHLTALDISKNTALVSLDIGSNDVKALDVSNNTALRLLVFGENKLSTLDVSKNTSLTQLDCSTNQLTSLDVSKNIALKELYCFSNQLTTLDVSKNIALKELYCFSNQLTTLDVSKNTALTQLWCGNNQLTTLDVSKNTALTTLHCEENQLTTLDVNTALTTLYCYNNQLTTLDLSQNTALTYLYCYSQGVSPLTITSSGNTSYPYQLDFSSLMTSENFANVSDVKGFDSNSADITTTYSNGIARFTALPVKVTYYYATGYTGSGGSMDVTLYINTPDTPTPAPSSPYYERGYDGNTSATAYVFTSQEDLTLLRDRVNNGTEPSGKYYKLNADIDLTSETDWKGIGNGSDFSGHFDGQGHAVIVSSDCPLFWIISTDNNEVAVENLKICGNVINLSSSTSVAALASQLKSGIINSCDFSGNVQANGGAGGLLDWISGGTVINCTVGAEMSAGGLYWPTTLIESLANDAGGIVSYMSGGVVSGCVIESGTIVNASSDLGDAGGIVGFVHGGTMRDCKIKSFAEVTGGFNAGGIVGFAYESQDLRYVRDCRVMSNVAITASNYAGGIAGSFSDGAIENCRVEEGTVITGTEYGDTGGIVSRVYNTVALSGNTWPEDYPQYRTMEGAESSKPYYERGNDGNSWETAYVLSSPEDLIILQERVKSGEEGTGKYYKLSADIDMTSVTGWYGIGRDNDPSKSEEDITRPFTGHVDGQNHTVYANPDLALFGAVRTANGTIAVRNLNLYGYIHYSPLAFALRSGIIENCNFSGTVETKGIPDSSGLISFIFGGTVRNCGVKADIHSSSGSGNAGGIVAYLSGGTIENCVVESGSSITASADASATADLGHAGGIVGVADAGTVRNCTVQTGANITASRYSGGIVGYNATASGLTLSGNSYPSSFREVGNRANPEPTPAPVPTPEPTPEPTPSTPVPAGNYYDRGYDGNSWENAYTLVSKEDFLLMASRMRSGTGTEKKYHKLDADIDLSDQTTWEPLAFSGYFDGQGHAITLNIDRSQSSSSSDVGASFFLTVDHVSNLRISGNLKGSYAAGIVHVLNPDNVIENCSFDGTIEATEMNAGGIVDEMRGGTVRNCAVTGKISSAKSSAGGIAGNMTSGTIEQCSVGTVEEASRVAGYSYTGGIAAQRLAGATESADVSSAATEGGYVKDCSANVELTNGTYRGGIVGRYVFESSVDNSDVYLTGNTWPDAYKQVGIVHDGGTIVDPDTLETGTNTVPIKLEVATISPVVVSDEVLSNLATLLSVDVSEIKMLTSDDIDSSTPPEPTAEMRRIVGRDNGIFLAKFNTLTVKEDGYYVFMVTVSDDLVGTSVGSLRAYAAEVSDFSAGSFSASFSFLPLINGVAGNLEVTNLLGLELDTLPKQFLMTMFLSASKSITVYLVKILLMLLAGCDAGLGVASGWLMLIAGSIIVVKAFKKKR